MVFIFIVTYGAYSLISNILSENSIDSKRCTEQDVIIDEYLCKLNTTTALDLKYSIFMKQIQLWLGFFCFIIWAIGFNFAELLGYKKYQ